MSKVDITLHGNTYAVSCDAGEEPRLQEVVRFVERKMGEIAKRTSNVSENRLLMLTCLMMADELLEAKKLGDASKIINEDLMVTAVEHLSQRVAQIANRIGHA